MPARALSSSASHRFRASSRSRSKVQPISATIQTDRKYCRAVWKVHPISILGSGLIDGKVTVFTGKAELGQGIKTALLQIAAEQLDIEFSALRLVTADTSLTPNERYTSGSHPCRTAARLS